jgi:hypothetical protein
MITAASEITYLVVTYGALALTLGIAIRGHGAADGRVFTVAGVTLVAVLVESLRAIDPIRSADATTPILAFLSACVAWRLLSTLQDQGVFHAFTPAPSTPRCA